MSSQLLFTNFVKNNVVFILLVLVAGMFVGSTVFLNDSKENFSTCYTTRKVYLQDVSGGLSEGHLTIEKNRGRLYFSFQGNLPHAVGGVYNHVNNGHYRAYLINKNNKKAPVIDVGKLLKYGDRIYRLKNELLGEYDDYTHFIIVHKMADYKNKVTLVGKL